MDTICECGNLKRPENEACEACTYLDGTEADGKVIAALRSLERATTGELADWIGFSYTHTSRLLSVLHQRGRVRRQLLNEPVGKTLIHRGGVSFEMTKTTNLTYYTLRSA